ncbi:hypothetical protein Tco_1220898 [Tanacetum coccineum]
MIPRPRSTRGFPSQIRFEDWATIKYGVVAIPSQMGKKCLGINFTRGTLERQRRWYALCVRLLNCYL